MSHFSIMHQISHCALQPCLTFEVAGVWTIHGASRCGFLHREVQAPSPSKGRPFGRLAFPQVVGRGDFVQTPESRDHLPFERITSLFISCRPLWAQVGPFYTHRATTRSSYISFAKANRAEWKEATGLCEMDGDIC